MDIDALGERLLILDSAANEIISVMLDTNGRLDGTDAVRINIGHLDSADLRGIAVHPLDGHLYVVSQSERALFELTQSGQLVRSYDLAEIGLTTPGGLAFIPSADLTNPSEVIHLLVADSNLTRQIDVLYLPQVESTIATHVTSETGDDVAVIRYSGQLLGEILELALEN